ncbi:MAG: succinate dehydrogenase, cytochrome b556 subunit [Rickettsiales bacterium]|nr:succinate dehydrogenase, cytochrome b556 subunit [Rickettsiales bacterium]
MTEIVNKPTPTLQQQRPLSPHLGIYRWQISNSLSILHRLTGVALSGGSLVLAVWLWCAAYAPEAHAMLHQFFATPFGLFMLVGWSVAFYYHLATGIRHLFWDVGVGFSLPVMTRSGQFVVIFTLCATAGTWGFIFNRMGLL